MSEYQSVPFKFTGVKVSYYYVCHTELWLFSHNIQMEDENEYVQIGRELHEERYSREKKDVAIDETISLDFVETKNGIVIHEIKKAPSIEISHRMQLLYYLYYFKTKGMNATGVINYPLISRKEEIILTLEDEIEIEKTLDHIRIIVEGKMPQPIRKKFCPKCSYFEFCFGSVI